jgi:hypothetical protein
MTSPPGLISCVAGKRAKAARLREIARTIWLDGEGDFLDRIAQN